MITKRQMTIEDFLEIMAQNSEYYPDYVNLPDEHKRFLGQLNISTGVANTYFINGVLSGVGGMRYCGMGEAWTITSPKARNNQTLSVFRETVKDFHSMINEFNLLKVYADNTLSENFLKHLGFTKAENTFIWVRS
jgi:hypothetical protein